MLVYQRVLYIIMIGMGILLYPIIYILLWYPNYIPIIIIDIPLYYYYDWDIIGMGERVEIHGNTGLKPRSQCLFAKAREHWRWPAHASDTPLHGQPEDPLSDPQLSSASFEDSEFHPKLKPVSKTFGSITKKCHSERKAWEGEALEFKIDPDDGWESQFVNVRSEPNMTFRCGVHPNHQVARLTARPIRVPSTCAEGVDKQV
jgi:hypothetical protein